MVERIVAAMSGGVDSSVAAALLVEAGHEVVGVTMRVVPCAEDGSEAPETVRGQRCCTAVDVDDARATAAKLSIPHYVVDVKEDFRRAVLDPFVADYAAGRTPVPCVACNHDVKFGALLSRARELGAAAVATGHYARIDRTGGRPRLLRAADAARDQTYFLYGVTAAQLARMRFPLAEWTKARVREKARSFGLPTADKPDSQELCFIPDGDARGWLRRRLGDRPGRIVDATGEVLGTHPGVHCFTIGQRRGLGLAADRPLHVVALDAATNTVVVGNEEELHAPGCVVEAPNWIAGAPPEGEVEVRIRSRHAGVVATVEPLADGRARVTFAAPQRSVTPGQAAVFSRGDEVLGGGVIAAALARPTAGLTPAVTLA